MKHLLHLVTFLILFGFVANPPTTTFTKKQMGAAWPFKTIQAGTVQCINGMYVILVATNGRTYTLNAAAAASSLAQERGWNKIDSEHIVGKDIGPMLTAGRALCR